MLLWFLLLAQAAPQGAPPQANRGHVLFTTETNGTRCATCHLLAKEGTPIAPDINRLARLSPRAFSIALLSTRTEYVEEIRLRGGETFPAIRKPQAGSEVEVWDLSKKPPLLRKLDPAQIVSRKDNTTWTHPPESTGYTKMQLSDIIAYVRWASYGDQKAVSPKDLQ